MAQAAIAPRIAGYAKTQKMYSTKYTSCWALQYEQDDRFRREEAPEILRKESDKYNRKVERGWWDGQTKSPPLTPKARGATSSSR